MSPVANSASVSSWIWEDKPALPYHEAFMIGNGRLGAALRGIVQDDRIYVNEDSIWTGDRIRKRCNPDALANMPKIQEYLRNGKMVEAGDLASFAYVGTPLTVRHYDFLGELQIKMSHANDATDYERWVDLDDAVSGVSYTVEGVNYTREYFASEPAGVLAIHLTSNKPGVIDFFVRLQRGSNLNQWQDYNEKIGHDTVIMGSGTSSSGPIEFAAGAKVIARTGKVYTIGNAVKCEGADEAWIYFDSWSTVRKVDPKTATLESLNEVGARKYNDIRAEHIQDYQALAGRVTLNLGQSSSSQKLMTTSSRLAALNETFDPELASLYFQFGRYLLIASSRKGTLPPNLQGIWNDQSNPKWGSKYTININLQMNYWPALVTNLAELDMPLLEFIEKLRSTGVETAREMYGVEGACAHHNTDLWADSLPVDNYVSATWWPSGLGWLATHIFEHYAYTGDKTVLLRYYPAIRDSAIFYLNFMTDYRDWKVTNPSMSPESMYYVPNSTHALSITLGPTSDNSLVWVIIGMVLECQDVLEDRDEELISKLKVLRDQLPPLRLNSIGGIMEWIEDYDEQEPGHRHWSHLYGLYPASQITASNKYIFQAAKKSIANRLANGGGYTGWSRAWTIALAARAFDPEEVGNSFLELLTRHTHPSLLDMGPPAAFQVDGNHGGTAGVAEALLQSHEMIVADAQPTNQSRLTEAFLGNPIAKNPLIRILPALPSSWSINGGGSVTGLLARGGFEVDIAWDENSRLTNATITSKLGGQVWVTLGNTPIGDTSDVDIEIEGQETGGFVLLNTKKGQTYRLYIKK